MWMQVALSDVSFVYKVFFKVIAEAFCPFQTLQSSGGYFQWSGENEEFKWDWFNRAMMWKILQHAVCQKWPIIEALKSE